MKRIISILCVCVLLTFSFTACNKSNSITTGSLENNASKFWSMKYKYFDGVKKNEIKVKENEVIVVQVDVTSTKGELDISIVDKDGNSYYQGKDIPTSNFSVELKKAGDYTIKATARKHKGNFKFAWETK